MAILEGKDKDKKLLGQLRNPSYLISQSIYREPEKWTSSPYIFRKLDSGICIWIGNGPLFVGPDDNSQVGFNVNTFGKYRIWKAYKWWLGWYLTTSLDIERKFDDGKKTR